MYLKDLTLVGFKSFAEKTILRFQPGVTAIVGPNGCGKSNVSDAVRWVLGEQSARALRGSEMADVIFNGTDSRKAVGMAEVSLTISDIQSGAAAITPIPGVSFDYNEVTVTRRVFRDGQSQYFINKTPCRLKDIQQLFWDTGIGRTAYSIMEQGKIDLIISSHPEDRRMIFEEAAGITKFKHQKKEALRKLEYTEANLVRLTDIIREVKRQIGSLQRQAGKARRYKELHEQLKRLDCALTRHKYDLLGEEIKKLTVETVGFDVQARQSSAAIESDDAALSQLRRDLDALDRKIHATEQREFESTQQADRATSRIEFNTTRIAEFQSATKKHSQDITEAEQKIIAQQESLAAVTKELEAFGATLAAAEAHLKTQQDGLRAATDKLRAAEQAHRDQQNAVVELQRRIADLHNQLTALQSQKRDETLRFERLSAEKAGLEERLARIVERCEQFQQQLQAERSRMELTQKQRQKLEQDFADTASEETALGAELAAKQNQLASLRSRLQTLEQLQQKHHAEQENQLAALRQSQANLDASTILASLSQVITIEPDYVAAIEAALGNHLQAVLVRDADAAKTIRASLNEESRRSLTLAPMDLAGLHSSNGEHPRPNGSLCWASDLVATEEEFRPLVRGLLDGVAVALNLSVALDVHRATSGGCDVATLDGEFVSRRGMVTIGAHSNGSAGLPVPQSHITELAASVSKLAAETGTLSGALSQSSAKRAQAETALQQARGESHTLEVTLATRGGEFGSIENEYRETKNQIETVRWEIQRLGEQGGEEKDRHGQIQTQLVAAEQQNQQAEAKLAEFTKSVDDMRAVREEASQNVTDAKVAFAAQQQKRDTLVAKQAPVAQRVTDLRDLIESRKREIEEFGVRIQQLDAEIEQSKAAIADSQKARESIKGEVLSLQSTRETAVAKIESQELAIRAKRKAQSELQSRKNDLEIQLAQRRMEAKNLTERIARAYQVNIEDIRSENITVTVADSGQPQKTEVGPTELAQAGLAPDWNVIETQVAELQAKVESMGPVNIEAIGEYEELEQRHKFLTEQHDDLTKSQQQLMQLISKINSETRKMFSETFEKVRGNFQQTFTDLFGGGKANLILADENDPLESGIEIVAKPPGKQLQSISLLSGGEKALTAVALLFSIYMVKPSPFCLLDEIDAPLDESNINRFIKTLQRFVTQSQFVVISHSKRTIAMADAIYGVTMEDHGVSKLVSVKFTKKAQNVAAPVSDASKPPGTTASTFAEVAVPANVSPSAIPGATTSGSDGAALPATTEAHAPGHEPVHNDLLNEHDSRRAPVTPHHTMESYEPEDEAPDDSEIATEVVKDEQSVEGGRGNGN